MWRQRIKYGLLSKQESKNMAAEIKDVTVKFYGKHSLKEVLTTTYTLDKKFFVAATFADLRVGPFQADQK